VRYRQGSDVVYRNGAYLSLAVLITVLWIAAITTDLIAGREAAVTWALVGLFAVPAIIYFNLRQRVVLGESDLCVYEYLAAEQIPYESIAAARFTGRCVGSQFLEIYHTEGWKIGVHGCRAAVLPFHAPRWQRPLAAEIMERAERARMNESSRSPATQPMRSPRSDRQGQDRLLLVLVALAGVAIGLIPGYPDLGPFAGVVFIAQLSAAVLAGVLAGRYLRRWVLAPISTRLSEGPSTPVRIMTRAATFVAAYAVGVLVFAAVIDVPAFIIDHFV
jgi:hypothetical protein